MAENALPKDKMGVAYISYFILGAGTLTPWNTFITAVDYFNTVYPDGHMDRKFSLCYLTILVVSMAIFTTVLMFGGDRSAISRPRMLFGFSGYTVLLLAVPIIDSVLVQDKPEAPPLAQILTLLAVGLTATFDGVSQGAVIGDASYLPNKYQQAYSGGTAAAGVLVSMLRILTKLVFGEDRVGLRHSTILYFAIGATLTAVCAALSFCVIPNLAIIRYYHAAAGASADGTHKTCDPGPETKIEELLMGDVDVHTSLMTGQKSCLAWTDHFRVAVKLTPLIVAQVLIFSITLTIFPGVPAEDVHSNRWKDWYNIFLITSFNVGDFVGRSVLLVVPIIQDPRQVMWWSVGRILFIPAFFLVVKLAPLPYLMLILVIFLGLTNGILTTNAFMLAPRELHGAELDLAGNLLVFALAVGLAIGAAAGWLWLYLENL